MRGGWWCGRSAGGWRLARKGGSRLTKCDKGRPTSYVLVHMSVITEYLCKKYIPITVTQAFRLSESREGTTARSSQCAKSYRQCAKSFSGHFPVDAPSWRAPAAEARPRRYC